MIYEIMYMLTGVGIGILGYWKIRKDNQFWDAILEYGNECKRLNKKFGELPIMTKERTD